MPEKPQLGRLVRELAGLNLLMKLSHVACALLTLDSPPLQNPCTDILGSNISTLDDVRGL
jgi:hypothetical protein